MAAMSRALIPALVYFAAVFGAGFALGVLRTTLLTPLVGRPIAVALELPVILGISWWVCGRILRRAALGRAEAAAMGALAFALLMAGEAMVSTQLMGRSLPEHFALYARPTQWLGLAGQVAFALFPLIRAGKAPAVRGVPGAPR
jgi:hypothetical protein